MQPRSFGSVKAFFPPFEREELLRRLRAGAARLARRIPIREISLIGSWAQGRATAFSDLDMLVIYEGPVRDDVPKLVRQCFRLRGLEVHAYAQDQTETMGPVIGRMKRTAILLWPHPPAQVPPSASDSAQPAPRNPRSD